MPTAAEHPAGRSVNLDARVQLQFNLTKTPSQRGVGQPFSSNTDDESELLALARKSAEHAPVSSTILQRSITKRKEATNVFSPLLLVCNKTSLQKRFADLSDTPTF
jgi:hypothetical protein